MNANETDWLTLRRIAPGAVAVVPMGSFEQHGPHLPMGADCMLVEAMLDRAVAKSDPDRVAVFPTVQYSFVEWARPLASVGLSMGTLLRKLVEIFGEIHALGFRRIITVNGHAGLTSARNAFWQLRHGGTFGLFADVHPYEMLTDEIAALAGEPLTHAGTIETAMMLAAHPDRVDMSKAVDGPADLWGDGLPFPTLKQAGIYCVPTIEALPDGVEGRATAATAKLGETLLDHYAVAVADVLNDLLASDVPDLFLRLPRTGEE